MYEFVTFLKVKFDFLFNFPNNKRQSFFNFIKKIK